MTDTRLFAAMLRAVLNLEHWPTDTLEREVQRLLDIAGLELAPAGASLHYAATFEDGSRLEMFHVVPPAPLILHPDLLPDDPRVEMDARTRRISAGLEAPPAGVVTTFHAVPDAAMPRCPTCDHLEHGTAVCGTRVPLGWADAVDARVPDTCQCDG